MHRITHFALVLLAATAFAGGVAAADLLPAEPGAADGGDVATPNHDPHHLSLVTAVPTPNHDPYHAGVASNLETLRAEPEAALSPAPAFVAADTLLYAKANARLRAAPSITADVVTKLAADAPLRAIARSADGVWWKVTLADRRTGYMRRDAVIRNPVAKNEPPASTAPNTVAATSLPPVSARRSQSVLGFVDETMAWLVDMAGRGSPPKVIRTER